MSGSSRDDAGAGDWDESLESLLRRLEGDMRGAPIEPRLREVGGILLDPVSDEDERPRTHPEFPPEVQQFGLARTYVEQDPKTRRFRYVLEEPELTEREDRLLKFLRDSLIRTLRGFPKEDTPEAREVFLLKKAQELLDDHAIHLEDDERLKIEYYLIRNLLGYDRIHVLLTDPQIEDISCDGPGVPIFVFHRRHGSMRTNIVFDDEAVLDGFIIRMAQRCGKHISVASPILDATLPDRSRLQATLSREVTARGSSFTIRRFREVPVSPVELISFGTISAEVAAYIWLAVEEGLSAIVAGGTASGKTTALNAVSLFIPPDRKIVSIEDTRELNIPHENWIAGVTRAGFGAESEKGRSGVIDTFKLLEAALRQRPEYILVGEVRGREAFTLFQAMATGHATYASMHADSATGAVRRLENPPISVPRIMLGSLDVLMVQMQTRVGGRAVRRTKELVEFLGTDPATGEILTNTLFRWDPRTDRFQHAAKSYVVEKVAVRRGMNVEDVEDEWVRRAHFLRSLEDAGERDHAVVAEWVQRYYSDPEGAFAEASRLAAGGG